MKYEEIVRKVQERAGLNQKADGEVIGSFATKELAIVHADDVADPDHGDTLVIHNIDGSISKREAPSRVK